MRRQLFATTLATLLAAALPATAATFELDPAHTTVQFGVRHLMVSTVRGTFGKVQGRLALDEQDPTKSTITATIDAASIDTRNQKRDDHLRSPEFLDAAQFPTLTFKSTQIKKLADEQFEVTGDLTIRGVTKPVTLKVEGTPKPMNDPFGLQRIGGSGRTRINRKDFGISWNKALDGGGVVVGDDIDITIDVEFTKAGAPPAAAK